LLGKKTGSLRFRFAIAVIFVVDHEAIFAVLVFAASVFERKPLKGIFLAL